MIDTLSDSPPALIGCFDAGVWILANVIGSSRWSQRSLIFFHRLSVSRTTVRT